MENESNGSKQDAFGSWSHWAALWLRWKSLVGSCEAVVKVSWWLRDACFACFAVAPGRAHCLLDAGMAGAFQAKKSSGTFQQPFHLIACKSHSDHSCHINCPWCMLNFCWFLAYLVYLHATPFSSCLISQGLFKSPWPDMARHAAARQTGMVKCQWKAMRNLRPSIRSKGWLQRRHLNEVVQCVLMCSLKPCLLKLQRYPLPVEIARVCYSSWNDFTWCHFFGMWIFADFCCVKMQELWQEFMHTLRSPMPLVVRINRTKPHWQEKHSFILVHMFILLSSFRCSLQIWKPVLECWSGQELQRSFKQDMRWSELSWFPSAWQCDAKDYDDALRSQCSALNKSYALRFQDGRRSLKSLLCLIVWVTPWFGLFRSAGHFSKNSPIFHVCVTWKR